MVLLGMNVILYPDVVRNWYATSMLFPLCEIVSLSYLLAKILVSLFIFR